VCRLLAVITIEEKRSYYIIENIFYECYYWEFNFFKIIIILILIVVQLSFSLQTVI